MILLDVGYMISHKRYSQWATRIFWKERRLSLHYIYFKTNKDILVKSVDLTAWYRCDQDMMTTLNIAVNMKEYKKNEPSVSTLYIKSDNAGYHERLISKAMFKLSKAKGFQLIKYDFNEPCKGKDHCDWDSAAVKTILQSYVDSGSRILHAERIHLALRGRTKIDKVVVVAIDSDSDKSILTGDKIRNFQNFHSVLCNKESITLWKYFNTGTGINR